MSLSSEDDAFEHFDKDLILELDDTVVQPI